MNYKFLPHTADIMFQAFGSDMAEALKACAYATTDIITDHTKVEPVEKHEIQVESEDDKAMVYDFLEQLLILLDSDGFLLSSVDSINVEGNLVTAIFSGDTVVSKYDINTHIKAVTYCQMEIEQNHEGVMIQVVIDI